MLNDGHYKNCQQLAKEWQQFATEVKGQVVVGQVNGSVNRKLLYRYKIAKYPTFKFFPKGEKSKSKMLHYNGARTAEAFKEFALKQIEQEEQKELHRKEEIEQSLQTDEL